MAKKAEYWTIRIQMVAVCYQQLMVHLGSYIFVLVYSTKYGRYVILHTTNKLHFSAKELSSHS